MDVTFILWARLGTVAAHSADTHPDGLAALSFVAGEAQQQQQPWPACRSRGQRPARQGKGKAR